MSPQGGSNNTKAEASWPYVNSLGVGKAGYVYSSGRIDHRSDRADMFRIKFPPPPWGTCIILQLCYVHPLYGDDRRNSHTVIQH